MNSKTIVLLLSGCLLFSGGCMQDHDRDNDNQKSGIAPADADKSSQPASKTNAPDSGLGISAVTVKTTRADRSAVFADG